MLVCIFWNKVATIFDLFCLRRLEKPEERERIYSIERSTSLLSVSLVLVQQSKERCRSTYLYSILTIKRNHADFLCTTSYKDSYFPIVPFLLYYLLRLYFRIASKAWSSMSKHFHNAWLDRTCDKSVGTDCAESECITIDASEGTSLSRSCNFSWTFLSRSDFDDGEMWQIPGKRLAKNGNTGAVGKHDGIKDAANANGELRGCSSSP